MQNSESNILEMNTRGIAKFISNLPYQSTEFEMRDQKSDLFLKVSNFMEPIIYFKNQSENTYTVLFSFNMSFEFPDL